MSILIVWKLVFKGVGGLGGGGVGRSPINDHNNGHFRAEIASKIGSVRDSGGGSKMIQKMRQTRRKVPLQDGRSDAQTRSDGRRNRF